MLFVQLGFLQVVELMNKDVGSAFAITLYLYVLNVHHQDTPYNPGKMRLGLCYDSSYKVSDICGYTVTTGRQAIRGWGDTAL